VRQIFKEMYKQMKKGLSSIGIFLAAIGTKTIFNNIIAVQTSFIFAKRIFV
jgi:hypothetical protein